VVKKQALWRRKRVEPFRGCFKCSYLAEDVRMRSSHVPPPYDQLLALRRVLA
jgi:hypothetical protein